MRALASDLIGLPPSTPLTVYRGVPHSVCLGRGHQAQFGQRGGPVRDGFLSKTMGPAEFAAGVSEGRGDGALIGHMTDRPSPTVLRQRKETGIEARPAWCRPLHHLPLAEG